MKTTFDLPEPLLRDVQRLARERQTTARSLVEQALIRLLETASNAPAFRLADASVGGDGLTAEFRDATWERIRDIAYGAGG